MDRWPPWDVAVPKKPCPLLKWGGGRAGRARLVSVQDRVCSLGRRHEGGERSLRFSELEGWWGSCKMFCLLSPLFLHFAVVWRLCSEWQSLFGSEATWAFSNQQRASLQVALFKNTTSSNSPRYLRCYVLSFHHLEGISVRYFSTRSCLP